MNNLVHRGAKWGELGENGIQMGAIILLDHPKWSTMNFVDTCL